MYFSRFPFNSSAGIFPDDISRFIQLLRSIEPIINTRFSVTVFVIKGFTLVTACASVCKFVMALSTPLYSSLSTNIGQDLSFCIHLKPTPSFVTKRSAAFSGNCQHILAKNKIIQKLYFFIISIFIKKPLADTLGHLQAVSMNTYCELILKRQLSVFRILVVLFLVSTHFHTVKLSLWDRT